jgi:DNA-binding transcriptional LysR family regulator
VLSRRVSIEFPDIATGVAYVRHGLGIALLPSFSLEQAESVVRLTVTGADLQWPSSLATPTGRPPGAATRALVDLIYDFLA